MTNYQYVFYPQTGNGFLSIAAAHFFLSRLLLARWRPPLVLHCLVFAAACEFSVWQGAHCALACNSFAISYNFAVGPQAGLGCPGCSGCPGSAASLAGIHGLHVLTAVRCRFCSRIHSVGALEYTVLQSIFAVGAQACLGCPGCGASMAIRSGLRLLTAVRCTLRSRKQQFYHIVEPLEHKQVWAAHRLSRLFKGLRLGFRAGAPTEYDSHES